MIMPDPELEDDLDLELERELSFECLLSLDVGPLGSPRLWDFR